MGEKKPYTATEIIGIILLTAIIVLFVILSTKILLNSISNEIDDNNFNRATTEDIEIISTNNTLNGISYTIKAIKNIDEIAITVILQDKNGNVIEGQTQKYNDLINNC